MTTKQPDSLPSVNDLDAGQLRVMIAGVVGKTAYRFCGDSDEDHDPWTDYESTRNLPPHLAGCPPRVKCHKCDGSKWATEHVWDEHSDAKYEHSNFTSDANDALTLCDWMAEKGWQSFLNNSRGEWNAIFTNNKRQINATGKTQPLAISKAFAVANGLAR